MCNATIPISDEKYRAFQELAAEMGVSFAEWALSLMENAYEDHELAKMADEAYAEYLEDPVTYTLDEVMAEFGDE